MTIPTYSSRVTKENGKIIAWVDRDNSLCIEQPNHPDKLNSGENWATEAEAQAWANEHATVLTQMALDQEAEITAKAEQEALDIAARQAILDNATKVNEIYDMLKALSSK